MPNVSSLPQLALDMLDLFCMSIVILTTLFAVQFAYQLTGIGGAVIAIPFGFLTGMMLSLASAWMLSRLLEQSVGYALLPPRA